MSKESEALKVWNAVEKYLNLYHHQAIEDDINVETVEGMPIKIIEKSLKALEIIKEKGVDVGLLKGLMHGNEQTALKNYNDFCDGDDLAQKEYSLLKEVLL